MDDIERRLSALLHAETPEPPRLISAADIRARAQHRPVARESAARHRPSEWGQTLLAAAAVVAAAVVLIALAGSLVRAHFTGRREYGGIARIESASPPNSQPPNSQPPSSPPPTASSRPSATPSRSSGTAVSRPVPPAGDPVDHAIGVYGNCHTPTVEPTEIVLTCADAGVRFEHLRWSSWTATGATAVGTLIYNDCTPSCARGTDHQVPATLVLTAPVRDPDGRLVWSRIEFHPEPPGFPAGPEALATRPT